MKSVLEGFGTVSTKVSTNIKENLTIIKGEFDKIIEAGGRDFKLYKQGDKTAAGKIFTKHGAERANERGFTSEAIDNIIANNGKKRVKEIDSETGQVGWRYQDARGNTVILDEWNENIVTVYSHPKSKNGGNYIPKGK